MARAGARPADCTHKFRGRKIVSARRIVYINGEKHTIQHGRSNMTRRTNFVEKMVKIITHVPYCQGAIVPVALHFSMRPPGPTMHNLCYKMHEGCNCGANTVARAVHRP